MFGGISHKLSMLRKKSGSSLDVTPNSFVLNNDSNASCCNTTQSALYFEGQITGINTSITLKFVSDLPDIIVPFVYYRVSQTSATGYFGSSEVEVTTFAYEADNNNNGGYYQDRDMGYGGDGITLTASNGDYVGFAVLLPEGYLIHFDLKNTSDNNTILDGLNVVDCSF